MEEGFAALSLGVKLKEHEKRSSRCLGIGLGLAEDVIRSGERGKSGVSRERLKRGLFGEAEGEWRGDRPASGVRAPGISRSLTRSGSVVVAAGEMVPSKSAVAVLMGDEDDAPPVAARASCCESERAAKRERERPPSSLMRRPCDRVSAR